MFFISGVRNKDICSVTVSNSCESCGKNQAKINVYQSYLHIFWIPFFPLWKIRELECGHCKLKKDVKSLEKYRELKDVSLRAPAFTYLGLIVIASLILYYSFLAKFLA